MFILQGKGYNDKLWISIMAGVVLEDLSPAIHRLQTRDTCRIVRTIPNTPVKVS